MRRTIMKTRTSIAAAAMLLLPGSNAVALDASAGGISAGVGNGGASVGVGDISVGVGIGGGVSVGGGGGGTSGGTGSGSTGSTGGGSSTGTSAGSTGGTAGSTGASASTTRLGAVLGAGARITITLPASLRPRDEELIRKWLLEQEEGGPSPLVAVAGAPTEIVSACRQTVAQAAQPYGLVDLSVVSAGPARPLSEGGQLAPLLTRIVYQRQGGYEMRQAPIWCQVEVDGTVSGLIDAS
jgi:hypothetical protein